MPGSPETSTTWPSRALARAQRRSNRSISSSRPTSGLSADPRNASNRLSTALGRNTCQTRTGAAMPFTSTAPRSWYSKRSPTSRRVPAAMTTAPCSASACSRAARFGVSPTTDCSCAEPLPIRSPTTTSPVAIPTRLQLDGFDIETANGVDQTESSPHRPLGVVLVGARIAEIDENAVAHVLRDKSIEAADDIGDSAVIGGDDLAVILGIEARGERGRADEIVEHHRQLAAFRLCPHPSLPRSRGRVREGALRGRRHLGAERRDDVEQPPTMADQVDAEILQVLGCQARQYPCVDLVRAECRLVLLEPELPQPARNIHRRHAVTLLRICLTRQRPGSSYPGR